MYDRMAANPGFYPDPVPETRRGQADAAQRRVARSTPQNGMSVITSRWFAKPETTELRREILTWRPSAAALFPPV